MRAMPTTLVTFSFILAFTGGLLFAAEADEQKQRAKALRAKAVELASQGKHDEAERLEVEALKLLESVASGEASSKDIEEPDRRRKMEEERQRLQEAMHALATKERKMRESDASEPEMAEIRNQMIKLERAMQETHAGESKRNDIPHEFRAQAEKLEHFSRRIQHVRVAAENLKLAEEHDLAHDLAAKAEGMEHDFQEAKRQLMQKMQQPREIHEGGVDVVAQLKAEIGRLRAELQELRDQLKR